MDSWPACSVEAGELIDAGVRSQDTIELGDAVRATEGGITWVRELEEYSRDLESDEGTADISLFKSVGIAVQDVTIAQFVLLHAEELGLGQCLQNYDF